MSTAAEPRWRRIGPDGRRQQILRVATHHFGTRPYPDVEVTAIAEEAGVTRALVNHYFGPKRELYLAVVRSMLFVPIEDEIVVTGTTRRERIEGAIDWLMAMIETAGASWVQVAGLGARGSDPELQEILDAADDLAADRLLEHAGFESDDDTRVRAHAAVRAFGGMVKAMARELVDRDSVTSAQARALLTAALEAVLDEAGRPA